MPHDWDEDRVRTALIERADTDGDTALMKSLEETACFELAPPTMVDGQLYVSAQTTNAVYR